MRALIAILLLVNACFAPAGYCERPPDDPAYFGRLDSDAWKHLIEQRVQDQQAGAKPDKDVDLTWQEYWTSWYSVIRRPRGLPWKGSEFKTTEDMVGYIKQRL